MSRYSILVMLMVGAMIASACSAGSPVSPAANQANLTGQIVSPDNHAAWGVFDLAMDAQTGTAEIIWNREAENHINGTSYLKPPNCGDCIVIASTNYNPTTHRFLVQLNFKNPTTFTGYDVRAVLSSAGGNKFMMNADGVTTVWGAPMQFRAINVDPERTFGPGEVHGRVFDFYIPPGENFKTVTYIVDASYPGYVLEPMIEQSKADPVVNNNFSTTYIQCYVFDHQNDLATVTADLMPIGGSPQTTLYDDGLHNDKAAGDHFFGATGIKTSAPLGLYRVSIYAKDAAQHQGWGEVVISVQQTTGGDNHDPVIMSVVSDRTTANGGANEKCKITVIANDEDGDALQYTFQGSGTFSGQNEGVVYWKPSTSATGKQTINVKVEDTKGGLANSSIQLWSTNMSIIKGSTSGMIPAATLPSVKPVDSLKMDQDFDGKVLYCNFWATWCGWCTLEMPDLSTLYDKYKSNPDYQQCLIDLGEDEQTALNFINGNNYTCSYWLLDQSQAFFDQCKYFNGGQTGIPQHFLFDRDGHCRWSQVGAMVDGTGALEDAIDQLL